MPVVEQTAIIKAPIKVVMESLNQIEKIPTWTTVTGAIANIQGNGLGMTYEWRYTINQLSFGGKSEVIEQTETTLMTKTTGDINSLWMITLTPIGKNTTAVQVVIEYIPPKNFIEVLADVVLEQLSHPEIAQENIRRFKEMVETQAAITEEQIVANY